MEIKKTYGGALNRKILPDQVEFVGVSGDNNSVTLVFKFPESYSNFTKYIEWEIEVPFLSNKITLKPIYLLKDDAFTIPHSLSKHCKGLEVDFNLIIDKGSGIREKSRQSTVFFSKSANSEDAEEEERIPIILELASKAFIKAEYTSDHNIIRPTITYSTLDDSTQTVVLDVPFLNETGTIYKSFLDKALIVDMYPISSAEALTTLTEARKNCWAVTPQHDLYLLVNDDYSDLSNWVLVHTDNPTYTSLNISTDLNVEEDVMVGGDIIVDGLITTALKPESLIVTDEEGNLTASDVLYSDLESLAGIQGNIQGQLNAKEDTDNKTSEWNEDTTDARYPTEKLVKDTLDTKLDKNELITAGTHPKITYDANGLVTGGEGLGESDIPELGADKITSGVFNVERIPEISATLITSDTLDDDRIPPSMERTANKVSVMNGDGEYGEGEYPTAEAVHNFVGGVATTLSTDLNTHVKDETNPHKVTADQVGLGMLDLTTDLDKPVSTATQTALDKKLDSNEDITGATKCKITYDKKGLVTTGADLTDTDIPSLATSKITGLDTTITNINTAIGDRVIANTAITGDTKCKITYDAKGLVTKGDSLADTDIPNLSATKITSDTFDDARIPSTVERTSNKVQEIPLGPLYEGAENDYPSVEAYFYHLMGVLEAVTEQIKDDLIAPKADDDSVVHLTGDESISGTKSFKGNVNIGEVDTPNNLTMVGNLSIEGNIIQNGSAYETHAEKLLTTNDKITLRDGAVGGLLTGETAGFTAKLYDGTTDGELAIDNSGTIRVGDIGDTQPVLTRKESIDLTSNGLLAWDATNFRAVTRSLGADDVPNISATKITSDTMDDARIPSSIERTANKVSSFSEIPTDSNYPTEKLVKGELDKKVVANTAITGATKCKITYDAKGLISSGADLADTDIPDLAITKITGLDTALTNINTAIGDKVTGNTAITGATKCKITYDSKGLVTTGADLADTDIPSLATSKITGLDTTITNINTAIGDRVIANTAITGDTKCKITYDAKGLVTKGADLADTDIPSLGASKITTGTFDDARIPSGIERTSNKVSSFSTTVTDTNYPTEKLVKTELDKKVVANTAITGATKCKITYDSKGLVTTGADLADTDIPSLATSKITGLDTTITNINTAISNKVTGNTAITAGTKCKITYDAKGLVTIGADLADTDIPSLATSKITGLDTTLTNINTAIGNKVTGNTAITAGTKCKITYDTKGLVTKGEDLADTDIPSLAISKITGLQTALDGKLSTAGGSLTGAISLNGNFNDVISNVDSRLSPNSSVYINKNLYVVKSSDGAEFVSLKHMANGADNNLTLSLRGYSTVDKLYFDSGFVFLKNQDPTPISTLYEGFSPVVTLKNVLDFVETEISPVLYTLSTDKLDSNTAITGDTKCKITYDSKGLVTSGADLVASDIPALATSKITGLDTVLNGLSTDISNINTSLGGKVDSNSAITSATKCKISYDAKGLVTVGEDLADTDIPSSIERNTNKVSAWQTTPTDTEYPTEKLVKDTFGSYLPLAGGTMTGGITITGKAPNQSVDFIHFGTTTRSNGFWSNSANDIITLMVDGYSLFYGYRNRLEVLRTRPITTRGVDDVVVWGNIIDLMAEENGIATLDNTGKIPIAQLPDLDVTPVTDWSETPSDDDVPSEKLVKDTIDAHTGNTSNPHSVTKAQVGLSNVDNTSDLAKPISTSTQSALDAKQPNLTGGATTIASSNLTSSRALISNSSGKVAVSPVTATELGYVGGVTSPIQSQIDTKVNKTGAESIGGVKTFTDNVNVGLVGTPKQLSLVGDLNIQGNITQNGTAYEVHAEQIHTKDDKIIMRDGATAGLLAGDSSGFTFKKYDGTNDGELSVDSSGTARVGDVGDLQPLATRNEAGSMTNNQPVVWDASSLKMVTRALVAGDIPSLDAGKISSGTFATGRIPNLDAGKITTGTFADSRIPTLAISKITGLQTALDAKVDSNTAITGATKTKITYDAKGLVTAGADLVEADIPALGAGKITSGTFADARIPALEISKITGLQTVIDSKITANTAITGATKCKITYDTKGLVTAGADLIASDIPALDTAKITTGTFVDARIPSLNASKITAGTFADARIPTTVERTANKVDSWQTTPTDTAYPTEKLVKDSLDAKATASDLSSHTSNTSNPHSVTKAQVGLSAVANELQYSASNPPPYPVTSVAGKTGAVVLAEADIPALSAGKITSGTFADARIPNLNGSKITAGTVADARLPTTVERTSNKKSAWQTTPTDTAYPTEKLVKGELDKKVVANTAITGATKTKITYDAKGLVTGGADLTANDIPSLNANKITAGTLNVDRIPPLLTSKITGLDATLSSIYEYALGLDTRLGGVVRRLWADSYYYEGGLTIWTVLENGEETEKLTITKDVFGLSNVDNTSDKDKPISTATQTAFNNKVDKNTSITGATKCKITYDSKGLVTAGADLVADDIPGLPASKITSGSFPSSRLPALDASKITSGTFSGARIPALAINKITGLQTALDGKVVANDAITAGTKAKITYDSKGLVTAGADLVADDIPGLPASKITSGSFPSSRLPALDASKITSGIFADARIPVLAISKITGLQTALDGKQTNLTFDNVPVSGSNNPVKSGGVYSALDSKSAKIYVHDIASYPSLNYNLMVKAMIITSSSAPFNLSTLAIWLYERGYSGLSNTATSTYPATGGYATSNATDIRIVYGLSSDGTTVHVHFTGNKNLHVDDLTSMGDAVIGV